MNAQTGNTNPKKRFGNTKPPMHLIPPVAAIEEAVVMGLGAAKYGAYNWLENHVDASTYIAAIERHLKSWQTGEDRDPESGASHLAHIRCCCAILMDSQAAGILVDDRPKGAASAAEAIKRLTKQPEAEVAGVMNDAGVDGAARDAVELVDINREPLPWWRSSHFSTAYHSGDSIGVINSKTERPLQAGDIVRCVRDSSSKGALREGVCYFVESVNAANGYLRLSGVKLPLFFTGDWNPERFVRA